MSSEESKTKADEVPEEELIDDMTREEFAAKVMDAVHEGILGILER